MYARLEDSSTPTHPTHSWRTIASASISLWYGKALLGQFLQQAIQASLSLFGIL